jgi:hypothetical protein
VEVVKPRPLRQLIAAHVQRMLTQYAKEIASLGRGRRQGEETPKTPLKTAPELARWTYQPLRGRDGLCRLV